MREYSPEEKARILSRLKDWRWRFTHLYWIKPAERGVPECLFVPRDEQWEILEAIYERGEMRLAILKARQLGFSTLLALICLDQILFNAGYVVGIVDQTQEHAKKKIGKILFAWDRLPVDIRGGFEVLSRNKSELTIQRPGRASSTVYGGMSARGDTHHILWISEWGAIQFDDEGRSDDIADGALPSAELGLIVVETTWKGGKTGRLYTEVVDPALKIEEIHRALDDWKIYFYAWWLDAKYERDGDVSQIAKDCREYFDKLEARERIALSDLKKLWYYKVAWPKKRKRFEEYPSALQEIFNSPVDGSIYGEYVDDAMVQGRVIDFVLTKEPVFTFWDLGKRDLMVITFIQIVGAQVRIYDYHAGRGGVMMDYARFCQRWELEKDAFIAGHYLPHDGGWERLGKTYNKSIAETLAECGLRNIQVVPRIPKLLIGIENVRDRFPTMLLHATNLNRVYEFDLNRISMMDSLKNYRFAPLGKNSNGSAPLHDINSHCCDSVRTFAEGDERGMVPRSAAMRAIDDLEEEKMVGSVSNFDFY